MMAMWSRSYRIRVGVLAAKGLLTFFAGDLSACAAEQSGEAHHGEAATAGRGEIDTQWALGCGRGLLLPVVLLGISEWRGPRSFFAREQVS